MNRAEAPVTQVLVVEDDADIQEMLAIRLRRAGYGVTVASDAQGGLAAARRVRPDVVLLDVLLPGMSGLELCRRIRRDERLSGIGIVVASASVGESHVAAALAAGADEFVAKPFSLAALLGRVRAVAGAGTPAAA
jgi:two-component system phosphate regulon response regulator PhoB